MDANPGESAAQPTNPRPRPNPTANGFGGDLHARHRHDHTRLTHVFHHLHPNPERDAVRDAEQTFDRLNFKFGDAKTEDFNFFVNAGMPLGPDFELYGMGSYGKRDGLSAANYRPAGHVNTLGFKGLSALRKFAAAKLVLLYAVLQAASVKQVPAFAGF